MLAEFTAAVSGPPEVARGDRPLGWLGPPAAVGRLAWVNTTVRAPRLAMAAKVLASNDSPMGQTRSVPPVTPSAADTWLCSLAGRVDGQLKPLSVRACTSGSAGAVRSSSTPGR